MRHHEETLVAFRDWATTRPETLGLVLVGSVARGDERADSDVDVYLVVTDDAYAAATRSGAVAYVSTTAATYPGGYVDVKLASPGYLRAAADHGDDPTRASFERGQVRLDRIAGLPDLVRRITEVTDTDWAHRVHVYRAQLALYGQYFLPQAAARADRFLLQHSSVHAGLAAARCALAQHHRFFRGQKYLTTDLTALVDLPSGFHAAWATLLDEASPDAARQLVAILDDWLGDPLPLDQSLSTFIAANELTWLNHTIPPEFW